MKSLLTLMLLSGMILCSSAEAKKFPPPAPTLAASINLKMSAETSAVPPAEAKSDINSIMSMSHSFSITPEQEAALQNSTVIRVMDQDFTLGSDPNFQNGDKSATFNGEFASLFPVGIPCRVSFKWNKGKMSISVKGKLKEQGFTPETVQARIGSLSTRSPYMFPLQTTITYSSLSPLTVQATLACDGTIGIKQGAKAAGEQYLGLSFTIQSKSYIYQN